MTPTGNWAAALDDKRAWVAQFGRAQPAPVSQGPDMAEVAGSNPAPRSTLLPDALDLAAALEEAAIDLTALAARIRTEAFRPNQDIAFVAIRAKGEARAVYDNLAAVFSACIPTTEASNGR